MAKYKYFLKSFHNLLSRETFFRTTHPIRTLLLQHNFTINQRIISGCNECKKVFEMYGKNIQSV